MNIIIGALAVATAVYLRIKFHTTAKRTNIWFALSVFVGLVSALTVPGSTFWTELGFAALALVVCGFVLTLYKLEINRAFARRRSPKKHKVSQAQVNRSVARRYQEKLSGVAAFYDDRDFMSEAA